MESLSPELLKRLLDEKGPALILYARQWSARPEDVVQEALVSLFRQTEPPQDITAWLYRAVRNGAISSGRNSARQRKHESLAAQMSESWFVPTLDDRIDAREATTHLETLPPEIREVVVARIWGGLGFEAIAQLAEISSSTAHRRYEQGLAYLRERLGVECPPKMN